MTSFFSHPRDQQLELHFPRLFWMCFILITSVVEIVFLVLSLILDRLVLVFCYRAIMGLCCLVGLLVFFFNGSSIYQKIFNLGQKNLVCVFTQSQQFQSCYRISLILFTLYFGVELFLTILYGILLVSSSDSSYSSSISAVSLCWTCATSPLDVIVAEIQVTTRCLREWKARKTEEGTESSLSCLCLLCFQKFCSFFFLFLLSFVG